CLPRARRRPLRRPSCASRLGQPLHYSDLRRGGISALWRLGRGHPPFPQPRPPPPPLQEGGTETHAVCDESAVGSMRAPPRALRSRSAPAKEVEDHANSSSISSLRGTWSAVRPERTRSRARSRRR